MMKKILTFVGGFIAGIIFIINLFKKIINKINKLTGNSIVDGIRDVIICLVSTLLYGSPDSLYVKIYRTDWKNGRPRYSDYYKNYNRKETK